ncbi:MAG: TolC family protein [Planctomycetota bacterium]
MDWINSQPIARVAKGNRRAPAVLAACTGLCFLLGMADPTSAQIPSYARLGPPQETPSEEAPVVNNAAALQSVEKPTPQQLPPPRRLRTERVAPRAVATPQVNPALSTPDATGVVPQPVPRGAYDSYLNSYRGRTLDLAGNANAWDDGGEEGTDVGPIDLTMWWDEWIHQPLGFANSTLTIDVSALTSSALINSPAVNSVLAEPQIRQTDVTAADSAFDPTVFLEGRFVDTNDPVGNTLTTGDNSDRFRDETLSADAGVRRRTRNGGELELIQRGGFQENNSIFLQPNPQGTTRLELNYTQPLRKDSGRMVNRSRIMIAQLRAHQASSNARTAIEDHLLEVTRAYWTLYRVRALWLQQQKFVGSARQLYGLLNSRTGFDTGKRQLLRARAELASRQSELTRAAAEIRDAQSRLRALVGGHELIAASGSEWLTAEHPLGNPLAIDPQQSVIEAIENRADISAALQTIHEVTVRVGASKNQVLPQLDLLLGAYVAGLDSRRDTWGALVNQFSDGRPGFSIGLAYEMPVGNRAARSQLNRRRWELFQATQDFRQVTEAAITQVEIAARETRTAFNEMQQKKLSVDATESEVAYLTQRAELLPDEEDSFVLLIDNLLDAQERLAQEERDLVDAQVAYALSWVLLRKATGVLLKMDPVASTANHGTMPSRETVQ